MPARMLSPAAALLATLLLVCQDCYSSQQIQAAPAPVPEAAQAEPVPAPAPEPQAKTLTPDIIYSVLVGDIAVQRGRFVVAYAHYLQAARLSRDPRLAELATRAALSMDDEAGAAEAAGFWLELDPDSATALQIAALLAVDAGKSEDALTHLRRIVELGRGKDGDGDGYMEAARLLARVKDIEVRVRLMNELLAMDPERPEAQFASAIIAASAGDNAGAERAAGRALELRPRWSEVQVFLVRVLLAEGKKSEAADSLVRFIGESPEDEALRTAYARLLVEQESYAEARKEFERLLESKPRDSALLFAVGVLSLQMKDYPAARRYLEDLLETGQRRDDALFYLGQLEEQEGNQDAALSRYGQIRSEHLFESQIRIARIHAERGDIDRSRELIQQIRSHSPERAETLYLIEAEILREIKRYEEAMRVYDEALAAIPDNLELLYARALQAAQMKRVDILERDLRRILEKNPDHADALNALGYTLTDQTDRYEEAQVYLKRALELKPDDAAVLDSMGWLQYRLGNNQDALRYLRRAADILQDPEIFAHLGEVLWVDGNRDEALKVWKEALERDPESDYLRGVIERLGVPGF